MKTRYDRGVLKTKPEKGDLITVENHKLNEVILKTINDVLLDIFGNKSVERMMLVMDEVYSLKWDEIPEKTEVFEVALRDLLSKGHMIIEDLILENLYPKFGVPFKLKSGYHFSDYMEDLKRLSQGQQLRAH